jgi:thiaminase/transcriptional activator TenA
MADDKFYITIRNQSDPLWQATFRHPFVQGIGDGSLSRERYVYYLKQDYVYLIEFSRVFALATAKAPQLEEMTYFSALLNATLTMEMDLHRRTCKAFDISNTDLEKTKKSMITTAYTNLMVKTCYEGNITDILAVLLPCAAGYIEIGQRLKKQGLPDNPYYQDWINTYSSQEFADLTQWLIDKMNAYAQDATEFQKEKWYESYLLSARFEYLFFNMSWTMEYWPDGIPQ